MINKLKELYDKIILLLVAVVLGGISYFSFSENSQEAPDKYYSDTYLPYEIIISDDKTVELVPRASHQLMPGNFISVLEDNGSLKEKILIESISLKRRSDIKVFLKGGREVEGRLVSQDDLRLGVQWKKLRQPLSISAKSRSVQNISFSEIISIRSPHNIFFRQPRGVDLETDPISFYQSKKLALDDPLERPRWTEAGTDGNNSIYDLFTPPIIYLVDGKLSTSLPEDPLPTQKIEEKFGMELIKFSNEPYPFRLVSWIGNTPYFEDTMVRKSATSNENIRNRLQVGVPYKRLLERRAGQPSLVPTTEDDQEKQLTVEKFVVQQYTDEKTGGLKVIGRALVKDHKLGGNAFEINNQMQEVFAGNVKIEVRMTLPELEGKTFSFTTTDKGISFDFVDRVFKVSEINESEKSILVEKKGPNPDQKVEKLLRLE